MARTLIVCALLAAGLAGSPAQTEPPGTETVVTLSVRPQAAPRPALKYQLLPEMREMNPGNPVQAYLKCFMEQQNFYFSKPSVDNREKWQTMPLAELPLQEMRKFGYGEGGALRHADYAARLDTPDWQILLKARTDGYRLLLPEVQQLRTLASALKVRLRLEIAERRFGDATTTVKTLFALARHLGEHPSLIGNLVGLAIAHLAVGPLEEMVQQPGCPNLYWALTDLPSPLLDLRKGAQGDRMLGGVEMSGIDPDEPMTEARVGKVLARLGEMMKGETKTDPNLWVETRARDEGLVRAARQRLVQAGLPAERLKEFPASQVILLDEKREYELRRDEVEKWVMLPYWQSETSLRATDTRDTGGETLFGILIPPFLKFRKSQARLDQRLALLRHVEALRLYAAAHEGKLPARLEDVPVPLPVDPFTGKPFLYTPEGQTAFLRGSPPRGEEKNAPFNVRYVVKILPAATVPER